MYFYNRYRAALSCIFKGRFSVLITLLYAFISDLELSDMWGSRAWGKFPNPLGSDPVHQSDPQRQWVSWHFVSFKFVLIYKVLNSRVLTGPDLHVYLLIHNIDGLMLRGEKTQSALGQLASLPNLHLVASIDHINAPLGGCLWVFLMHYFIIYFFLFYPYSWFFLCVTQCGTNFSRASLTGCGGSVWRSSTTQRRHRTKTHSWCSRLVLLPCPPLRMCCAAWHPTQGNEQSYKSKLSELLCEQSAESFMALHYLFLFHLSEESSNSWWNFSWKIKIILRIQVHTFLKI